MRIDLDTYREIIDTLTRNKTRSLLTGFGVFWGVFMLIVLIGGGQGLKEMLEKNFEGFATNTTTIWAQKTTKAYKGMNKGRSWYMDHFGFGSNRSMVSAWHPACVHALHSCPSHQYVLNGVVEHVPHV